MNQILLLVLVLAMMFVWLIFGFEILQYLGGPVLFFR